MQISPIKNPNFEKPSRNLSNRTKEKILKKNYFEYLSKKIWFRVCSVTAEMFEHRNLAKIDRKEANFFSKIYEGHIRIWFRSKKNSKLSHACVPLRSRLTSQEVAEKVRIYVFLIFISALLRETICCVLHMDQWFIMHLSCRWIKLVPNSRPGSSLRSRQCS